MDNREKILECALELFSSRGYDAVGVQEIVNTVGITKPTLYHYFRSKEGLLKILLDEQHGILMARIMAAADYKGDLPYTMYQLTQAYVSYVNENKRFYRMLLSMRFYPPDSEGYKIAKPLIEEQIHLLEELFFKASKQHGNMKGRQTIYAITYLGIMNAYFEVEHNRLEMEQEVLTRKVVHQFMHGIFS